MASGYNRDWFGPKLSKRFSMADGPPQLDANDPEVVEMGKFAVEECNKQFKADLKFDSVVEASYTVVAGYSYKLVVAVIHGDDQKKLYEANVWDRPWLNLKQLTLFTPYKEPAYKINSRYISEVLVNANDPEVVEVGKFAVEEHNKQSKADFKLDSIVEASSYAHAGAGLMYKLVVAVIDRDDQKKLYETNVWERSWLNLRELIFFTPWVDYNIYKEIAYRSTYNSKVLINANDTEVVEMGKFALEEHNKQYILDLKFDSVVKASSSWRHNKMSYELVVAAIDEDEKKLYNTEVAVVDELEKNLYKVFGEQLQSKFMLIQFYQIWTDVNSPPAGLKERKANDPRVVEIGKFVVEGLNRRLKTNLKFDHVVKASSRFLETLRYELVVAVNDGDGQMKLYSAEVLEGKWSSHRELFPRELFRYHPIMNSNPVFRLNLSNSNVN